jgi:hypothetical protein
MFPLNAFAMKDGTIYNLKQCKTVGLEEDRRTVPFNSVPVVIDHTCTNLDLIPRDYIDKVKDRAKMYYAHESHGEQINCGLEDVIEVEYPFYNAAIGDAYLPSEPGAFCIMDLHRSYDWHVANVREILDENPSVNYAMYCWCAQMNYASEEWVEESLEKAMALEAEYPQVTFIYVTGNAQASGSRGYNRFLRNIQIKEFCREHKKILYDFADLDAWWFNPVTKEWEQETYTYEAQEVPVQHKAYWEGVDCGHTNYANCGNKGKAFWWMMAQLMGWRPVERIPSVPDDPRLDEKANQETSIK